MSPVLHENRGFGNPNYNQITLGTEHGMIAGQQQLEQSSINRSLLNLMQLRETFWELFYFSMSPNRWQPSLVVMTQLAPPEDVTWS